MSLTRRGTRILAGILLVACLTIFLYNDDAVDISIWQPPLAEQHSLPPLYEKFHDFERHLAQAGPDTKFFWVANHVTGSGWGNAMQELLMNALLAYSTGRAFVFYNFTWARDVPDYSTFDSKLIPARIPLSAIISGPIIGSSFPPGDPAPLAVSRESYKHVCPNATIIDSRDVNEHLRLNSDVSALEIFEKWMEKLNSIEDPCVEITTESFQLFEIWLFGSERILSMWPLLSKSPILTEFSWSPLVVQAAAMNVHLFAPTSPPFQFFPSYKNPSPPIPTPTNLHDVRPILTPKQIDPIGGLLALHIRRGDFTEHCLHLAKWSSDWNGYNKFASLPDQFRPPTAVGWGETTEENVQMYLKSCFPSVEQIVDKVETVLADQKRVHGSAKELKNIYILTNGHVEWLQHLKDALMRIKKWDQITTSRDLKLSWEAKPVSQAIDMLIAQHAQVFVGNGFSSLTSNIIMLRMLKNIAPEDSRFW